MELQQMAIRDRPRAYVSGDAGSAFVVANGETYVITARDSRPQACSPMALANILALSGDVHVYEVPDEPQFSRVAVDVDRRTRASRCVDYIAAVLDPGLPSELRLRAAEAVQELFHVTPGLDHQVERVVLNVPVPSDADVHGATNLSGSYPGVHFLMIQIGLYHDQIARSYERWEQEISRLPTPAMRRDASALMARHTLTAELLLGTYRESLVAAADAEIRKAIARWADATLPGAAVCIPAEARGKIRGRKIPFQRRKLLVLQDDDALVGLYRELLTGYGFDILVAHNSLEAMSLVDRNPDILLVILDLSAFHGDGRRWLSWFRGKGKQSPIIVMGHPEDTHRDLGAATVLEKPFAPTDLIDLVGLFCGLSTPVVTPKM